MIKKTLFLILTCCIALTSFAQLTYDFKIYNTQGRGMPGVVVSAENKTNNVVVKATTSMTGIASFTLTEAGMYTFSFLDYPNAATVEYRAGSTGKGSKTITYDPDRDTVKKLNCDRKNIEFKYVSNKQLQGQQNIGVITLILKKKSGILLSNISIEVTDCKNATKYSSKTNSAGEAVFYLPINNNYEIDIEGSEAYNVIDLPNSPNIQKTGTIYYEPFNIKETIKNDTIQQSPISQTTGTSTHRLLTIKLIDFNGAPLANEKIYLHAEDNSRTYMGTTDKDGKCKFLLKKGSNYIANLKYENGIAYVEAQNVQGFGSTSMTRRYRGSANIEEMLKARNKDNKGFTTSLGGTPIFTAEKPANYLTKTDKGYDIQFKDAGGPIGTSTIINNKLYMQAGFYSPNFYCLDANTGNYQWGIELGESGISPAVYHNGVLLINTYSCTLYAVDAATGKLLWSKWLAGSLFSTPSADGNNVYVVYNNQGENPVNPKERFVLTCFDLKTGKINWMKWLVDDAIACPVIEGTEVHIASLSGNYYVFNKLTGAETIPINDIHAVSSPTLTPEKIYITTTDGKTEHLCIYNRKTLKLEKQYTRLITAKKAKDLRDSYTAMNFNGSHPIVYKNQVVIVTDNTRIMAFDANSEKLLWEKLITVQTNQLPVIANDQVVISTTTGDVMSYNVLTGEQKKMFMGKGLIDGQILSDNGQVYINSNNTLQVIKSVQNLIWKQWNKDAQHNGYFE